MNYALALLCLTMMFLPSHFEKKTEKEIKNYLIKELKINKAKVNLKFNNVLSAYGGKVSELNIEGQNLSLNGLNSSNFNLRFKNIDYSFLQTIFSQDIKIKKINNISEKFIITEKDLNNFINPRLKHLKNFYIKILQNKAEVSGQVDLAILNPSFKLEVLVAVVNKKELWIDIPKAKISIIPIPKFVIDYIFSEVNPIFVLAEDTGKEFLNYLQKISFKKYKNIIKNIELKKGEIIIETETVII